MGLAAVNGVATTYLRSDGAPALSQAIAPTWTGVHTFAPTARTSGVASFLTITPPADTTQTLSTESIGISIAAATRQWATGALTTQRNVVFGAPTIGFVGASTVTTAVNVDIADPVAGTNATLTNSYGLRVNKMQATGQITSTLAIGTAPFAITSTTVVPNLNVSQLLGGTWASPGTIGSTTPNTGAFTTLSATGVVDFAAGTVGTPSLRFGGDTTSGFYRIGANNLGVSISGAKVLDIASTGLAVTGTLSATGTITPAQVAGIVGTTTNNNAQAGSVGEYIESVIPVASEVSLTSNVVVDVTSISLTAGDWDVWGLVYCDTGATTTLTNVFGWVSSTSATIPSLDLGTRGTWFTVGSAGIPTATPSLLTPTVRFSLSGTTTVYLSCRSAFSVSTNAAFGAIRARRRR